MGTRGGDAIDAHLEGLVGGPADKHWKPGTSNRLRGATPLVDIAGWRIEDHWHLVTYGLSEMEEKQSPDKLVSGWGFELTVRVPLQAATPLPAARAAEARADGAQTSKARSAGTGPEWAVDLLSNLAIYVWTYGHPFAAGDLIDLRGPVLPKDAKSPITGAVVVSDPGAEPLDGPFGRVEFLQIVGVTADELEACRSWDTAGLIGWLAKADGWLVTRPDRRSILAEPHRAAELDQLTAASPGFRELVVGTLRVTRRPFGRAVVTIGGGASAALGPALRRELAKAGDSFVVLGDTGQVRFAVGADAHWSIEGESVQVTVPPDEVEALANLFGGQKGWGSHPSLSGLRFHVED